jgi:hypothetical protein
MSENTESELAGAARVRTAGSVGFETSYTARSNRGNR